MPDKRQSHDEELAAELLHQEADVGVRHIAGVYAEALLAAAEKAGQAEAMLEEFDSLVRDVLNAFPRLEGVLASALVSHEEKAGLLDRVLGGRASPMLLNFLKVLSRHERLDCLRAVHVALREQLDVLRHRVPVRIATASPISDALAAGIAEQLKPLLDGEPVVTREVDPSLIGGVVVRVGDTVFDGSVASQLEQMRQQMIDRSVHEIQSRRNRFRDPAGD